MQLRLMKLFVIKNKINNVTLKFIIHPFCIGEMFNKNIEL